MTPPLSVGGGGRAASCAGGAHAAAAGDEALRRHLAEGHDRLYLADTAYIEANAAAIVDSMPA